MIFDSIGARAASLVLAAAASLAGCGGGGGGDAMGSQVASTSGTDGANPEIANAGGASNSSTAAASAADASAAEAVTSLHGVTDASVDATPAASSSPDTAISTAILTGTGATVASAGTIQVISPAASAPTLITQHARSGIGMNLAGVFPYSAEFPTIDLMKKASPWLTQCKAGGICANFAPGASGYDTLEEAKVSLDSGGWVTKLPAASDTTVKFRSVTTKLAESAVQQAGTYIVLYDGSGTITYAGAAKKVSGSPGRDVVNVTNTDNNPFFLTISATDPTNYIRNIRVFTPGGACANDMATYVTSATACTAAAGKYVPFESFPAGTIWHPQFVAGLKGYRTLRFMDWGKTNANPAVAWTDRTPLASRSWNMPAGVPIEQMFDLASKVGADPWMNIPPYASDAYVKSFAQIAHAKLGAGQKLALEYGNEMWNYAFPATKWSVAQSQAVFAKELASGANASVVQLNWYALRLAQVCKIVKSEFGSDAARVQCVANTQAANSWNTNQVLKCTYAQSLLGQACAKFVDVVSVAPYFGGYIGSTKVASTVTAWSTDGDGGLAKMFLEINGVTTAGLAATPLLSTLVTGANSGAVAQIATWMQQTKAVADSYGLPMWAYEGGQSLIPTSGDPAVINLMIAANRDPRMGVAYHKMLSDWKNAGGQTFVLFSDVGVYGKSGMWGLHENQFDAGSPKLAAALTWRDTVSCWWTGC